MRQVSSSLFFGAFAPVLSLDLLSAPDPETGHGLEIADESPPVVQELELAELDVAMRQFISHLPVQDQEIVKKLFWEDQTQSQIAESMGVSKMAISKRLARICKRGRIALAAHHNLALIH